MTLLKKLHQINLSTLIFHYNPIARERVYEATRRKLLDPNISVELRGKLEKKLASYIAPTLLQRTALTKRPAPLAPENIKALQSEERT